jgi:hypothetical protein
MFFSYIQQLKRDKFIIEEHRSEIKARSKRRFNPNEFYYKINIVIFINVVKYRLINMKSIEQELSPQISYRCKQYFKEYTQWNIIELCQNNTEYRL